MGPQRRLSKTLFNLRISIPWEGVALHNRQQDSSTGPGAPGLPTSRQRAASSTGTFAVKAGLAQMLKGGVIMDVINSEQAKIAEEAGAVEQNWLAAQLKDAA